MAHSLSAKKRIRQNAKARATNRARKSRVKTQIKKFETVLAQGDAKKAADEFRMLTKRLDQTAATGLLHKKTVARRKSRMARRLNALAGAKAS
ncbi:MAG: 30S ribosomal protein S20 [Phycisphaerae bacterium]|nr:30S ribosomal protein S20 [Phycisphaerae bacterium]